ncbi:MAG TPA: hypothetical protein VFG04_06130 [Planctomycetaceae bacterium]|jgi:hypothetical protein|nr:hypothetical protein [Planctomycetaceae bacterium]
MNLRIELVGNLVLGLWQMVDSGGTGGLSASVLIARHKGPLADKPPVPPTILGWFLY